jgi:hypothetical protein
LPSSLRFTGRSGGSVHREIREIIHRERLFTGRLFTGRLFTGRSGDHREAFLRLFCEDIATLPCSNRFEITAATVQELREIMEIMEITEGIHREIRRSQRTFFTAVFGDSQRWPATIDSGSQRRAGDEAGLRSVSFCNDAASTAISEIALRLS